MGQAPDLVRDPDEGSEDVNFGTFNTGEPTPSTTTDDPEVIRNQIENTRADMTQTIDAIQERLNPETLKEHAKDAVREATVGRAEEAVSNVSERAQEMVHDVTDTARDAGTDVVDMVRQNPLPAALAGIGLGWLWMNRSKSQHQQSHYQPQRYATLQQRSQYMPNYQQSYQQYDRPVARYQAEGESQSMGDRVGSVTSSIGDAAGSVQHTARDAGSGIVDMVRENPLPAALSGIGLGWLLMNRSKSQHYQRSYYQPQRHTTLHQQSYNSPGFQEYQQREAQYHSEGGQSVGDRVGSVAGTVGDAAGNAAESVQQTAGQIAGQVSNFGSMAQGEVQDLRFAADRMLDENPIPMGFLALGLGLAVGMMIPETEKENQVFGEARENVMDRAQTAAQEVVEKVQNVVGDVAESAQQAAQQQGLVSS